MGMYLTSMGCPVATLQAADRLAHDPLGAFALQARIQRLQQNLATLQQELHALRDACEHDWEEPVSKDGIWAHTCKRCGHAEHTRAVRTTTVPVF